MPGKSLTSCVIRSRSWAVLRCLFCLDLPRDAGEIPLQKCSGALWFPGGRAAVWAPCCCGVEFDAYVSGVVDRLQVLSMNGVRLGDWVTLPGEVYRLTLGCVEVHKPVLLPDRRRRDALCCVSRCRVGHLCKWETGEGPVPCLVVRRRWLGWSQTVSRSGLLSAFDLPNFTI